MLNKFFKFLKGYVIIKVYGVWAQRFVNICVRRGIDVRDVVRLSQNEYACRISCSDFKKIRPVAFKTKTRISIQKKCGLRYLLFGGGGRWFFIGTAMAAAIFIGVMSQFVWLVEINGVYNSDYVKLEEILRNDGIYTGALKCRMKPAQTVKYDIITQTGTVSWAWVYLEGSKARVEIYEKNLPQTPLESDTPCDIIAACDAFIENIDVRHGKSAVPNQNAVSAGDLLVSGTVPVFREGDEPKYMYVHASASVRATTYKEASGEFKEYKTIRTSTGKSETKYSLELFGKLFKFYKNDSPAFSEYDENTRRHELSLPFIGYTGICLNSSRFDEVVTDSQPISTDTAVEIAKNELEEQLAKQLLKNTRLIEENVECERIDSETIRVTVKMTCSEDIGVEREITDEGVNMFDKPTD